MEPKLESVKLEGTLGMNPLLDICGDASGDNKPMKTEERPKQSKTATVKGTPKGTVATEALVGDHCLRQQPLLGDFSQLAQHNPATMGGDPSVSQRLQQHSHQQSPATGGMFACGGPAPLELAQLGGMGTVDPQLLQSQQQPQLSPGQHMASVISAVGQVSERVEEGYGREGYCIGQESTVKQMVE